jgi:hypothetical protein
VPRIFEQLFHSSDMVSVLHQLVKRHHYRVKKLFGLYGITKAV